MMKMPKTKDAFALNDFDKARILQRKFFFPMPMSYNSDFNTDDENLDTFYNVAASSKEGTLKMRQELAKTQRLKALTAAYTKRIFEHTLKLEKFMRQGKSNTIKQRAASLQQEYLKIVESIGDLQKKINLLIRNGEKAIAKTFCKELGERIRQARETLSLERKDVATTLGISLNTLAQYERGERELSPYTLARLSEILRRSANCLLGFTS